MDATRAAAGPFSGRVAHGSLLVAIAIGLGSMDVPVFDQVGMVGTTWRFLKPVRPGMTVHADWRLGRKRDVTNPRWGLTVWQVELHDQNQELVLDGEVSVLVNRRSAAVPQASRSRRRRRGKAVAATPPAALTAEANLPEPASADLPPPAPRKRRASRAAAVPVTPVALVPPEPDAGSETPTAATPSARRRRRRRGGGGGATPPPAVGLNGETPAASPPARQLETVHDVAAEAADPPRGSWAAPESASPQAAADNPVSRVFGRFRRARLAAPVAPAPADTRSPSE